MRTLATVVAFGLAAGSCWAGQNLFVNPSFELGNFTPNGDNTTVVPGGSTAITGWSVQGPEVAWIGTPNPFAGIVSSDGTKFVDLTSYGGVPGGVSQRITTVPGQAYHVEFDQGSGNYGDSHVFVYAADGQGPISPLLFTEVGMVTPRWDRHSYDFVAREASTLITFANNVASGNFSGLDNVAVYAASAPCIGDYDQDGGITASDIGAFFADYEMGDAAADLDLDGGVTPGDVAAFFEHYESGC